MDDLEAGRAMIGTVISHYRITEEIGRGGIGEVYLAHDQTLHRRVALKVLNEEHRLSPDAKHRFLREARILSSLDHPNICRIYDFFEIGERHFLVLEFLEGRNLRSVLKTGLDRAQALSICQQLADVLVVAHGSGIIHRDLKPENLMVTADRQMKVLDFGLALSGHEDRAARSQGAEEGMVHFGRGGRNVGRREEAGSENGAATQTATYRSSLQDVTGVGGVGDTPTRHGDILGTPFYMSPEQALGEPATAASDMYSFGLMMQEMFTGRRAYPESASIQDLYMKVAKGETIPVSGLSRDVAQLISRLKSSDPKERPSAHETAACLKWIREKPRRHMRRLAVAAVLLIVLFAAGKYTIDLRRERAAAVDARQEADQRRQQAESLIEFMLGDLRQKLSPVGQLDILDDVGTKALAYFASVPGRKLTDDELFRRAKALTQIGEVRIAQGRLPPAAQAFREAQVLSASLAARDTGNGAWQLGLGTSHFWLGYVLWRQDDLEAARKHFEIYREIAGKLVTKDPKNQEWQRELGYAHSNLGSVLEAQGKLQDALEQYSRCLSVEARLLARAPKDNDVKFDLANSHNAIGKVLEAQGRLEDALDSFNLDIQIKSELVRDNPRNASWREYLARSQNLAASVLEAQGRQKDAFEHYRDAVDILEQLVGQDPGNSTWQRELAINRARKGAILGSMGRRGEALDELMQSVKMFEQLVGSNPSDVQWAEDLARMRVYLARLLMENGEGAAALKQISSALDGLRGGRPGTLRHPSSLAISASARILAGEIRWRAGEPIEARTAWQLALAEIEPIAVNSMNHKLLDLWARALLNLGRTSEAGPVLDRLREVGYRKRAFWAFCRTRGSAGPESGTPPGARALRAE
ncbi:MAG: serine/threonine-protein kinase [Acidobacteria bacterium]|nr:MAG: serine/threonine-protein kinase [Acidobacteriota bacterium]